MNLRLCDIYELLAYEYLIFCRYYLVILIVNVLQVSLIINFIWLMILLILIRINDTVQTCVYTAGQFTPR